MPKVSDTRKLRALELLRRMRDGPSLAMPQQRLDEHEIKAGYQTWVRSWILFEIIQLVPELRALHKAGKISRDGERIINVS